MDRYKLTNSYYIVSVPSCYRYAWCTHIHSQWQCNTWTRAKERNRFYLDFTHGCRTNVSPDIKNLNKFLNYCTKTLKSISFLLLPNRYNHSRNSSHMQAWTALQSHLAITLFQQVSAIIPPPPSLSHMPKTDDHVLDLLKLFTGGFT